MARQKGCLDCGLCRRPCGHADCKGLGRCLHMCPRGLLSVAGTEWEADALATHVLRQQDLFAASGGGVTLSGGEPLLQADFAVELLQRLAAVHRAVETCGYGSEADFLRVLAHTELVLFDLKLADPAAHKRYTGVDNGPILRNFALLRESGKPYLVRVPLIPDITDTAENLAAIAAIVDDSPVELLPYNAMAGAKYPQTGRVFTDLITKSSNREIDLSVFQNARMRGRE